MSRRPKARSAGYTLYLEKGKGGAWNWEIRDPSGKPWSWGARLGTKAEVRAHCQKGLDRRNMTMDTSWAAKNAQIHQKAKAKRKAA